MLVKLSLSVLLETDANEEKGQKHDDLGVWGITETYFKNDNNNNNSKQPRNWISKRIIANCDMLDRHQQG